jgi:hypothetical protein
MQSLCVEYQASALCIVFICKISNILLANFPYFVKESSILLACRWATAENRIQSQRSRCEICSKRSATRVPLTNHHSTIVLLSCYLRVPPKYQRTLTQPQAINKNHHVRVFSAPPPPIKFSKMYIFFWYRSEYSTTVDCITYILLIIPVLCLTLLRYSLCIRRFGSLFYPLHQIVWYNYTNIPSIYMKLCWIGYNPEYFEH